jgi:integral membrane protein (TIGR01906 family)
LTIVSAAAKWLFVLCLPVLLLSASIGAAVNSLSLYKYGFDKYGAAATTGLAEAELEKAARGLIGYFNSGQEYITVTVAKDGQTMALFNQREVIHLRDVRGLIRLDYWVLLGALVYTLAYLSLTVRRKSWRQLASGLIGGSVSTLALMAALGIGALFNFDRLFLQFHLLSFSNDFWLLDPSRDYLIMLFPRGFWLDATIVCAIATVIGAVILGGVGIFLHSSSFRRQRG